MPAENTGTVEVRRDGDVAVVTLRRERKLNALSTHMESELQRILRGPEVRSSRAVVVTGGDTVFSAGADVTELREMTTQDIVEYYRGSGSVYEEFAALPQPTLAAIHGWCLGGGLELALAADFRIADESAVLGFPEVGIGILPSSGGTVRATRLLGPGHAKRLVLLGDRVSAAEALAIGLVTEVVPDAVARALELAHRLAKLPPAAVAVAKAAIEAAAESSHDAALLVERLGYALLAQTPEARRAVE